MSIDPKQPWFGRKKFGWGWVPRTWQGWGIVALFVVLSLAGTQMLAEREHGVAALIYQLLLVIGLIVICAVKGESLSERRGGK